MNIVDKLKSNDFTEEDLLNYLDSLNPIVLYHCISCIVRNDVKSDKIKRKLFELTGFLSDKYSMIGYYKLGHVAMGALLKLGYSEEDVFNYDLDDFEKDMAIRFYKSTWGDES